MGNFNPQNYATVAERLGMAADEIVAVEMTAPAMLNGEMGYMVARVVMADGRWAHGTASFRLDLQGRSAQATNPIEDCETSAVGRALAFLGYGASKSVASRNEVEEARRRAAQQHQGGPVLASTAQIAQLRQVRGAARGRGVVLADLDKATVEAMTSEQIAAEIERTKTLQAPVVADERKAA